MGRRKIRETCCRGNLAQRFGGGDLPQLAEFAEHRPVGLLGLLGEKVLQPQGFVVDELSGW